MPIKNERTTCKVGNIFTSCECNLSLRRCWIRYLVDHSLFVYILHSERCAARNNRKNCELLCLRRCWWFALQRNCAKAQSTHRSQSPTFQGCPLYLKDRRHRTEQAVSGWLRCRQLAHRSSRPSEGWRCVPLRLFCIWSRVRLRKRWFGLLLQPHRKTKTFYSQINNCSLYCPPRCGFRFSRMLMRGLALKSLN